MTTTESLRQRVVQGYPPNFAAIDAAFNVRSRLNIVYAYGDTIFFPGGSSVSEDVHVHESIHRRQQNGDPAAWWETYLADPVFRLDQEIEAYQAQYRFICSIGGGRFERRKYLASFVAALSGSMYGRLLSADQARRLIKGDA